MKKIILSIFMLTMIIGACSEEGVTPRTELVTIQNQKSTPADSDPCIASICPPLSLTGFTKTPTTINFGWTHRAGSSAYKVEVAVDSNFEDDVIVHTSGSINKRTNYYTIENLLFNTVYYIRVIADYTVFPSGTASDYGPTITVSTEAGIELNSPVLSVSSTKATSMSIEWNQVAQATHYEVQLYSHQYGLQPQYLIESALIAKPNNNFDMEYVFNDLCLATDYYARVIAKVLEFPNNETVVVGLSNIEPALILTTHNGIPDVSTYIRTCYPGELRIDFASVPGDEVFSANGCTANQFGFLSCPVGYSYKIERWHGVQESWRMIPWGSRTSLGSWASAPDCWDNFELRLTVRTVWPNGCTSDWTEPWVVAP